MRSKTISLTFAGMLWLTFLLAACTNEAQSDDYSIGAVPLVMLEHMHNLDCGPVRGFYSSYMVTEPPYVWFDDGRRSFAYVCERSSESSSVSYAVVIQTASTQPDFRSCSRELQLSYKPGGLMLETREHEFLVANFVNADGGSLKDAAFGERLRVLSVSTGTGGFVEYVCVNADWYSHAYS